ncbi:hypothetical protein [Cochleicola gelatinilyticus]|uniref:Uncharacterized protein n=1 Tax=Cochleicola gelatinilyticus TaxID=1763537 RepID=A0A167IL90_9FLAO|nr:hypothetical protein [Cochleicola gelatinilyticus]OAB79784.1 hypothetical protein ULVI_03300 [Cochleicola gelatinilyticus]
MNKDQYTYLLAHPQHLSKTHQQALAEVIEKYPYVQSARALQLKSLKDQNSFLYNDALKVTAAYTTDRDILFEYITSESFVQNEISQQILQHDEAVNTLEVISENVSEQVSIEIDNSLKAELKKAEAILNPELFQRKKEAVSEMTETNLPPENTSEATTSTSGTVSETPKKNTPTQERTKETSSSLELDTPLPFTKKDTHSFSEWLKLTRAKPIDRSPSKTIAIIEDSLESDEVKDIKVRKFELIDKFIQEKPKMEPKPISNDNKNLAKPFTQSPDALMTETLAKVYLQQKNYKKAIQAYKILILKNPEKSGFFADQIRAIEKLTNTEEK